VRLGHFWSSIVIDLPPVKNVQRIRPMRWVPATKIAA
jgi:hypothetical protein